MPAPFELIAAPFTLWLGPVGEAYPVIDAAPAGNWVKVGTSGDQNYLEAGVTVDHSQSVDLWRALGGTGPRKAFRTEESLLISLTLADLSLEQYLVALNHNTVVDTAEGSGTAGFRTLGLTRGLTVTQKALLLRGAVSPYGDSSWNTQYEVPVAVEIASPSVVFSKGGAPAALELQWAALEDPSASSVDERFGRLIAQDATALP